MSASIVSIPHPQVKKAKYMSAWESTLTLMDDARPQLGLRDLFGGRRSAQRHQTTDQDPKQLQQPPQGQCHPLQRFLQEQQRDGFFALRLEHREGGAVAKHVGEERILLFRSDRAGAIAKIIYSSTPAATPSPSCDASANNCDKEELALGNMAQAKIHVLDVKEPYRGHDFGGLLFSEAIRSLRNRYMDTTEENDEPMRDSGHDRQEQYDFSHSIRCQLDAEEDVRRHNKLIHFYEQLGCHVKPKAKVQYINNNDGEMYRKVPMQMALKHSASGQHHHCVRQRQFLSTDGSLVDCRLSFLPICLLEASGRPVEIPLRGKKSSRRVDWLVVDDGKGRIQFRTTQGCYLRADPDGRCSAVNASDAESEESDIVTPSEDWASFRLYRVSDLSQNEAFSSDESDETAEILSNARQKELWMLETAHGTFLMADSEKHNIVCSKAPAFWQADDDTFSLICTSDTPPRRQHYRRAWTRQTVEYVSGMRERYLSFRLGRMTLRSALDLVRSTPFHQFRVSNNLSGPNPSIRTLCFCTAEACRRAGHPDWVQFIALVHELGSALNHIDLKTAAESEDDFDWTITCRSRIVGCAAPDRTTFYEFRHLNADEKMSSYSTPQGMYDPQCGLENVLLSWTGPEYMYHMLRRNESKVPLEGLAMLRYFPLKDWHRYSEYRHLTNEDDFDAQPFVAEFDQLRLAVRREVKDSEDLSDQDCNRLWEKHYGHVVAKYVGVHDLFW